MTQTSEFTALGTELNVAFPPSARLLGIGRERGMDDLVEAKVEMDEADLAAFIQSTPVQASELEPNRLDLMGSDHGWWDPGRARDLKAAQAQLPAGRVFNLGVARGASGKVVLYLVRHET